MHGARPDGSFADMLGRRSGATGDPPLAAAQACSGRRSSPRTASRSTATRSPCSPSTTSPSRTARARTRSSAAASRRSRSCARRGSASASAPTARRRRRPSTCSTSCRPAVFAARARERRPDALSATEALELATIGSARALGLDEEVGSLVPGKHADLAVVSLDDSPYVPWEDAAAAVVFGGSPQSVITTLVDGEARYERGGYPWRELEAQRKKRAKSHAKRRPGIGVAQVNPNDTLFFPRLRTHAKWMFVALAIVFSISFVAFGVGSGSTGISDIFNGGIPFFGSGSSGGNSITKAQKAIAKHPKQAAGYRNLATALETKNRNDEAIAALESYTKLRPKDTAALSELAGLYLRQADAARTAAQLAQSAAASPVTGGGIIGPRLDEPARPGAHRPDRAGGRLEGGHASARTPTTRPRPPRRTRSRPTSGSPRRAPPTRPSSSSWRKRRRASATPRSRSRRTSSS